MKKWTKEVAEQELQNLIDEIDSLKKVQRMSSAHTQWAMRVLQILEDVFGDNSRYYLSFTALSWHKTGTTIFPLSPNPQLQIEKIDQQAYIKQLDSAKGMIEAALAYLNQSDIEDVYDGKNSRQEASDIMKIISLAENQLRKAFRDEPKEERDVQNAFENLLLGAQVPYSREGESIEYSTKKYIPDFIFKKMELIVEIKICNRDNREKELIAEINDDILAYRTKYPNLFFLVYDLGKIRDMERFSSSIENNGVIVKVIKH